MSAAAATATHFHTIIVGGGLAGLTVAENLAKKGNNVLLLEKYGYFGGRATTYKDPEHGIQYEIGAGRINKDHARVTALVRRFGLHTFPISTASDFVSGASRIPNDFLTLFSPIARVLETLPPAALAKHTVAELVPAEFHTIFLRYPYWAELRLLRADVALTGFKPEAAHGAHAAYYGITEGIQELATHQAAAAAEAGADCRLRYTVADVRALPGTRTTTLFEVTGTYKLAGGADVAKHPFVFTANRVVLATCRCSLSDFSVLRGTPLLKQVGTAALMRIYAMYPPATATHKVWFHDLPKIVTDSPLRYIIPINAEKGLIMISYTDGDDTKHWRVLEGAALKKEIQTQVKTLFPSREIPEPTFLQKHDWTQGCSYWLPGDYEVAEASRAAHNPAPGVYVCGESVSQTQTWIEGALESAETLTHLLTSA